MIERREDESVVERLADVLDSLHIRYAIGGTSEHQGSDVLGVLGMQEDDAYLTCWAKKLGVQELLSRAMAEAAT